MIRAVVHWTCKFDRTACGCIVQDLPAKYPPSVYRRSRWTPRGRQARAGFTAGYRESTEDGARWRIGTWARLVEFVDTAEVLPVPLTWPMESPVREMAGRYADHLHRWRDIATGRWLVTTEPYDCPEDPAELRAACTVACWQIAIPQWPGIWNPPATRMILMAPPKKGADVHVIARRLDETSRVLPGKAAPR